MTPLPPSLNRWRRVAARLAMVALLGAAGISGAQQRDRGPINLEADRAELNNATGESVYTGDVRLTRGDTVITGDRLELYADKQGQLERAVVTGQPATYKGNPAKGRGTVRGEAPRMTYHTGGDERLRMSGGATLWRGQDRLEGETVTYRIQQDTVEAVGGESGDGRINITLQPDTADD